MLLLRCFLLSLFAAPLAAAELPLARGTLELGGRFLSDDGLLLETRQYPREYVLELKPIPGGLFGAVLPHTLASYAGEVGGTLLLNLDEIEATVASIALKQQPAPPFDTVKVEPAEVRMLRIGTFASTAGEVPLWMGTGFAVGGDENPVSLVLVWFDQPVRISGAAEVAGDLYEFNVHIEQSGFNWVASEEYADARYRVTAWTTPGDAYVALYVRNFGWLSVERRQDSYFYAGEAIEREDLPTLLERSKSRALLIEDARGLQVGELLGLSTWLTEHGYDVLFRDANGAVRRFTEVPET